MTFWCVIFVGSCERSFRFGCTKWGRWGGGGGVRFEGEVTFWRVTVVGSCERTFRFGCTNCRALQESTFGVSCADCHGLASGPLVLFVLVLILWMYHM